MRISFAVILLAALSSATHGLEVRSKAMVRLETEERPYKHFRVGPTWKQRVQRLGEHWKRFTREIGDNVSDLAQDVFDPADSRIEHIARQADRELRDGGQYIRDKAKDGHWELQKLGVHRTFWSKVDLWVKKMRNSKGRANKDAPVFNLSNNNNNNIKKVNAGPGWEPKGNAGEVKEAEVDSRSEKSEKAKSKTEEFVNEKVVPTVEEVKLYTVEKLDDALNTVTEYLEDPERLEKKRRNRKELEDAIIDAGDGIKAVINGEKKIKINLPSREEVNEKAERMLEDGRRALENAAETVNELFRPRSKEEIRAEVERISEDLARVRENVANDIKNYYAKIKAKVYNEE